MKLDIGMTLLVQRNGVRLEIRDNASRVTFLRGIINSDSFMRMLSSQGDVEVEAVEIKGLEKLGKEHEHKKFEFEMPETRYSNQKAIAENIAQKTCPEGWVADRHFNSQDSFFTKGGKSMARCTIRRWIDKAVGGVVDCSNCIHDGCQMVNPSGCTGCSEYKNFKAVES